MKDLTKFLDAHFERKPCQTRFNHVRKGQTLKK